MGYIDAFWVGTICKICRQHAGKKVSDVAADIGCTPHNIYSFENGKNNNMTILIWYLFNTDLAVWMLSKNNPLGCKIENAVSWLDNLEAYRKDMQMGAWK